MPSSVRDEAFAGPLGPNRLSPSAIAQLSERHGEPAWLRERRLQAGRIYESLPVPRWQRGIRGWWTTDISALRLDEIVPYRDAAVPAPGASGGQALAPRRWRADRQQAGWLEQRDSVVVGAELDDALAAQGVLFMPLDRAAREHPELVQAHLGRLAHAEDDKFVALHNALWSGGVLLYVPAGVEVTLPLHAHFRLETAQSAMFVHTLLVAEPGSRVTYVEDYSSPDFAGQGLHSGIVEVYAKEGATVQFVTLHNWGESTFNFVQKQAEVRRDARMQWVSALLGSALTKATVTTRLREPGAELETLGIFFASGRQHLDLTSRSFHEAPHTAGDVLFKGVVKDNAQSAFEGLIRVEKKAQQTASYLSDHTLQLSREAKSNSIPSLEIEANDVRVSHGATVGMIDEEQLYYLMTRGLPRPEAERMIVGGFLDPVLQRVPIAAVRQQLLDCIERKMGA